MMVELDALVKGVPSLRECTRLKVGGPLVLTAEDRLTGDVELSNPDRTPLLSGALMAY